MTTDWPQIDTTVSLQAPNDLFGGDFFSDELNDMYITGAADIGLEEPAVVEKTNGACTPPSGEIDHGLDTIALSDFTDLMPPEAVTVYPISVPDTIQSSESNNNASKNPMAPNLNQVPLNNKVEDRNSPVHAPVQAHPPVNTIHTNSTPTNITTRTPPSHLLTKPITLPIRSYASTNHSHAPPASQINNKVKGKTVQTPNPLSNGNSNGTVVSPLPAPATFAPAPTPTAAPVTNGVHLNSAANAPQAMNNKPYVPQPQALKKTSSATIYAPSRLMCTPNYVQTNVMKNITLASAAKSRSTSNSNAIATAAAAASVSANTQSPDSSDFAAVAQAAVTNLMLNAAGNHAANQIFNDPQNKNHIVSDDDHSDPSTVHHKRKIDTSTAHVTALTSPNWVAACASMSSTIPGTSVTAPVVTSNHLPTLDIASNANPPAYNATSGTTTSETNDEETPAAKRRRQNLNPEERAKQNRDRNREHARNTRLRKKAYVEELKRTLTELVAQRDACDLENRRNAQRELEQREVRFRVMEEFLKLRGSNEPNVARWVAILEDGFTCTLPFTNYRSVVKGVDANAKLTRQVSHENSDMMQTCDDKQVLYGAPECMADATALAKMLSSIGKGKKLAFAYNCDRKRFLMDGTNAVLEWAAKSIGQDANTLPFKCRGSLRASFSPASNKLISCELCFDTGPIISQLRKFMTPSYPIHDDFAASIFSGNTTAETDRLLDSLEMPMLPAQVPSSQKSVIPGSE